jgi:hypothetical protein
MLHFAAHPTRDESQEFTDNVCRRSGSQHKSSAEVQIGDISLRRYAGHLAKGCFRHTLDVRKAVEVERDGGYFEERPARAVARVEATPMSSRTCAFVRGI